MRFSASRWAATPLRNVNLPEMRPYQQKLSGRICYPRVMYFKEVVPMTLKNSVSGKAEKESGPYCIYELSQLLSCMKKHDFYDLACKSEHQVYYNCVVTERKAREEHSKAAKEGKLGVGGMRDLSSAQINRLMREWPQPSVQTRKHNRPRIPLQSYADPYYTEKYGRDNYK